MSKETLSVGAVVALLNELKCQCPEYRVTVDSSRALSTITLKEYVGTVNRLYKPKYRHFKTFMKAVRVNKDSETVDLEVLF